LRHGFVMPRIRTRNLIVILTTKT